MRKIQGNEQKGKRQNKVYLKRGAGTTEAMLSTYQNTEDEWQSPEQVRGEAAAEPAPVLCSS